MGSGKKPEVSPSTLMAFRQVGCITCIISLNFNKAQLWHTLVVDNEMVTESYALWLQWAQAHLNWTDWKKNITWCNLLPILKDLCVLTCVLFMRCSLTQHGCKKASCHLKAQSWVAHIFSNHLLHGDWPSCRLSIQAKSNMLILDDHEFHRAIIAWSVEHEYVCL